MNASKTLSFPFVAAFLALAALAPRADAEVRFSDATLNQHPDWVAWWNAQGFLDGMTAWAEKISTFMCGSAEPARRMDFYITLEKDGLAGTGDNRITIGNDWAVSRVAANDARDVRGCIVHELTHAVQYAVGQYLGKRVNLENIIVVHKTDGTSELEHLTEGMADWIRWYNYEPEHYRDDRRYERFYCKGRTLAEYGNGCEFIDYLATTYGTGFVSNMCLWCADNGNASGKIGRIWPALTGRTYEQLLADWAAKPTFADPLFQWTYDGTTDGIRRAWPSDDNVSWNDVKHPSFKSGLDELVLPPNNNVWWGGELSDENDVLTTGDWTIALRGRFRASGSTTNVVFSIGSSWDDCDIFALGASQNEICAAMISNDGDDLSLVSATTVCDAPSKYHTLVAVKTNDKITVYVDGGTTPVCQIDASGKSFYEVFGIGDIFFGIGTSSPLYTTSKWRPVQSADGFRYQDARLFHRALGTAEIALYFDAFHSSYGTALGWVNEEADTTELTGEWSDGIDYETDGRALLLGENAFTPYAASTGNVVTVDVKATLFESDGDDAADAGTQAGVRLGTNGCFQVWTGNGVWVDVSAPGVTPVDGGEYTFRLHFYYASGKYSVAVVDEAGTLRFCAASGGATAFNLPAGRDRVSGVVFSGETRFTSLLGKCAAEGFAPGLSLTLEDAAVVLNAAKAAYLNSIGAYTAVNGKVATLTRAEFDRAYLCNLDLTQDGARATLALTGIRIDGDAIELDATLTRTHPMMNGGDAAPINGVIRFYGARALAAFGDPNAAPPAVTALADGEFGEDAATAVFTPGENVFFKARIEER